MGYSKPRLIFPQEQESSLKNYLLQMAFIVYGYTPKDARCLVYECADQYKIKIPESWIENKMANKELMTSFLKRNLKLSIRTPKPTSLGRATSFNTENVKVFYDKLGEVMDIYKFSASTVDYSGPIKIMAAKGKQNVGAIISGERGNNVIVATAVSASGNTVPLIFVFPRKNYKDYFVNNGRPDLYWGRVWKWLGYRYRIQKIYATFH